MRNGKKRIIAAIAVTALLGVLPAAAANVTDISGHWAQSTIQSWVDSGKISGYPDGTFKPESNVTRAEMVKLINNAYSLTASGSASFTDVPSGHWAYAEVQKAVTNGYVSGDGNGIFRPDSTLTRAEAAVMLSKIDNLSTTQDTTSYTDNIAIASWAKPYVSAVTAKGVMNGYPDGSFGPNKNLTRAEAVTAINKALAAYTKPPVVDTTVKDLTVDSDKVLTGGTYKNITITKTGALLNGITINNDLTITSSVGSGTVTLKNLTIKGDIVVKGGGSNSVYLSNCQVSGDLVADKSGVALKLDDDTKVSGKVYVRNDASIQSTNTNEKPKINNLVLENKDTDLTIGSRVTVNYLTVDKAATGGKITIDGTVGTLTPNVKVTLKGSGTINKLENTSNATVSSSLTIGNGNRVSSVSLNKTSASVDVDKTITLTATISPTDSYNKKINWSSSDTSIATVDTNGVVKGIKSGTATIKATADDNSDKYATCSLTVGNGSKIYVTGVTMSPTSISVPVKQTAQLSATVAPSNATDRAVSWTSNDPSIATVSSSGLVTGVKVGTATITVKTDDGSKTATCTVTVTQATQNVPVESVTLSDVPTAPMSVKGTATIKATVTPDNATNKAVTWSSSKTDVATIDADTGLVTAVAPGEATITATTKDGSNKTATCKVTVAGITLNQTTWETIPSGTIQLTATVFPEGTAVTWTSDSAAVTVSDTGFLSAVAPGTATITATAGGQSATCVVTVSAATPVTKVELNETNLILTPGGTFTLTATVEPGNATNKNVTWSSSGEAIATVTDGLVEISSDATPNATVIITASAGDKSASCTINILAATP